MRDVRDPALAMEIDDTVVTVGLPTERPLYRHRQATAPRQLQLAAGSEEFDSSALVSQIYVDRARLAGERLRLTRPPRPGRPARGPRHVLRSSTAWPS